MPGGKLDFQELLVDAAYREVFEETGIKVNKEKLEILSVQDDIVPDKHFVTIGFLCKDFEGEPKIMEPEEITEWKWYNLDSTPKNIFPPSGKMLKKFLELR
jgi:ADP-ribose pyrophosphatase YjhB (NUDIX family)